jgi:hypothetical protein
MPQPYQAPAHRSKPDSHYDPNVRYVRLKTLNPKRGIHMRRWSASWKGRDYTVVHDQGWYRVPLSLAKYLESVPARHGTNPGAEGDEDQACAFAIKKTIAEAKAYDEKEQRHEAARVARNPSLRINDLAGGDLTTTNLRPPRFDDLTPDDRVEEEVEPPVVRRGARADERDDGNIDDELAALEQRRTELLAAKEKAGKSSARVEHPDDEKKQGDEEADEEEADEEDEEADEEADEEEAAENPDLNRGDLSKVDFKAEGDKPVPPKKKSKSKKAKAARAAAAAGDKAKDWKRTTQRDPSERSLRVATDEK